MATPANQAVAQDAETIEDLGPWTVVPGGDVMLVVGAKKVQILASASFLSHVSAMFEKMFSGGMKEVNSLVNRVDGQPTRIELPDDNPEAVYHGIQILYGSNPGSFTLPPEPSEIYLSFQTKQTCTGPGTVDKSDLQAGFDLLVASYWFDYGEGFFIMS
ncbi:hypothetical protein DER46DRAFT_576723 [Fusarium sp. MPI-SDFR-AT-0072]|nr:hypothetical protein DER46DRAFT_576723 [Fusarium sp. MPI-SDFR-AT-0072]